jgi:hypothetical protein
MIKKRRTYHVGHATRGKAGDQVHRPRRIGLCPRNPRHGRERGSARCQNAEIVDGEVS